MTLAVYSLNDPTRRLYPLPRREGEPRNHYIVRFMYELAHAHGIGIVAIKGRNYARELVRRGPAMLGCEG
jgi:hypothetical protein